MKNSKFTMVSSRGCSLWQFRGMGKTYCTTDNQGHESTTNDAGAIVSTKLSSKHSLTTPSRQPGATKASKLTLVYVQNASSDTNTVGDFIEVRELIQRSSCLYQFTIYV